MSTQQPAPITAEQAEQYGEAQSEVKSAADERAQLTALLDIAADKSYRFAEAYRDVVGKRDKARARAKELSS